MYTYDIVEDAKARETYVQWYVGAAPLAFRDTAYPWSRYGRQGAYQAASVRVKELYNADSHRNATKRRF